MENKIKTALEEAKKNANEKFGKLKENIVLGIDQNDDGKFDKHDVSVIADNVEDKMKRGIQNIKDSVDEKSRQIEIKTLNPLFLETICADDFLMPKFVRITDRGKKYIESEVCQGAIGYTSYQKSLRIVNIFRDSVELYNLSFYPDEGCEFYYVDPSDKNRYIALNEYFNYLKEERVSELQMIAKSLGAKHFRVTFKEEKAAFTKNKITSNAKVVEYANVGTEHITSGKDYSAMEIKAELSCEGHAPVTPTLKFLEKDPSIKNLIAMRMDERAPLLHQRLMLKLSNSSGIKESDAVKLDAVLKGMKLSGNATVLSEVENESRRYLEYEIDF